MDKTVQTRPEPLRPITEKIGFRYSNLSALVFSIWPVGILLMHFKLAEPARFNVTIAVILCSVIVIYLLLTTKMHPLPLLLVHLVVAYALLLGLRATDHEEYFRSLAQLVNLAVVVQLAFSIPVLGRREMALSVRVFLWGSCAVAVLIILQCILLNLFGSYALMNPFGDFMVAGPGGLIYEPHPLAPLKRPNGLFSEPSVAGWIMGFAGAVALASPILCRRNYWYIGAICMTAAVLSFSLSGFINVAATLMIYVYVSTGSRSSKYPLMFLALILLGAVAWVFVDLQLYTRLYTMFDEGESVYFRFVAPLKLLADSLPEYPFGHPLGHIEYIATKSYMINWDEGVQTNIDNSFFFASYYLGILGVVASLWSIWAGVWMIIRRSAAALIVVIMLLALSQSGSLWSHGTVLVIGYSIILARFIRKREKEAPKRARLAWQ